MCNPGHVHDPPTGTSPGSTRRDPTTSHTAHPSVGLAPTGTTSDCRVVACSGVAPTWPDCVPTARFSDWYFCNFHRNQTIYQIILTTWGLRTQLPAPTWQLRDRLKDNGQAGLLTSQDLLSGATEQSVATGQWEQGWVTSNLAKMVYCGLALTLAAPCQELKTGCAPVHNEK